MPRLRRTVVCLGSALLLGGVVTPVAYADTGHDHDMPGMTHEMPGGEEMSDMDMTHEMPDGEQMSDMDMSHQMPGGEQMPGMDMGDMHATPADHPTGVLLGAFGAVNASVLVAAGVVRKRRSARSRLGAGGAS